MLQLRAWALGPVRCPCGDERVVVALVGEVAGAFDGDVGGEAVLPGAGIKYDS